MSADDQKEETTLNPTEFFETIGNKVAGFSGAAVQDGATTAEEEYRPVEEIESLCMSCGEN
ncbi:nucleolar zinc-finger protein, partial [Conoideocrella luteorostrata]